MVVYAQKTLDRNPSEQILGNRSCFFRNPLIPVEQNKHVACSLEDGEAGFLPCCARPRMGGGVTQTCSLLFVLCRTGRRRATTGTASTATYQATSCPATTASGSITSNVCRRSANPETEAPTGSASSAGWVLE